MRSTKIGVLGVLFLGLIVIVLNGQTALFHVVNFFSPFYDKDFYRKNYQVEGDKIYLLDPKSNTRHLVKRRFSENFENASNIRDLISLERGWTTFTLQSPQTPDISDYNKLQKQILKGEKNFLDNRVEPSTEQAHMGKQSLKTLAVASTGMVCTKSSLATMLLHFVKGDDVWFSAWYYYDKMGDFDTLMDLETTFVQGRPGMRICLSGGRLHFELAKWEPKSVYRQKYPGVSFPTKRWVHIKAHLKLSEKSDGIAQLWQDDQLIIDQQGQTLPFAEAVYNDLEIGLSGHNDQSESAVLYVDDMEIDHVKK
jgi:hypothetical protein